MAHSFQDLVDSCNKVEDSCNKMVDMVANLLASCECSLARQAAATERSLARQAVASSSPTTTTTPPPAPPLQAPPTDTTPPPTTDSRSAPPVASAPASPPSANTEPSPQSLLASPPTAAVPLASGALTVPLPAKCSTKCLSHDVMHMNARTDVLQEVWAIAAVPDVQEEISDVSGHMLLQATLDPPVRVPPRPPDLHVPVQEHWDVIKVMQASLITDDASLAVPKQEKAMTRSVHLQFNGTSLCVAEFWSAFQCCWQLQAGTNWLNLQFGSAANFIGFLVANLYKMNDPIICWLHKEESRLSMHVIQGIRAASSVHTYSEWEIVGLFDWKYSDGGNMFTKPLSIAPLHEQFQWQHDCSSEFLSWSVSCPLQYEFKHPDNPRDVMAAVKTFWQVLQGDTNCAWLSFTWELGVIAEHCLLADIDPWKVTCSELKPLIFSAMHYITATLPWDPGVWASGYPVCVVLLSNKPWDPGRSGYSRLLRYDLTKTIAALVRAQLLFALVGVPKFWLTTIEIASYLGTASEWPLQQWDSSVAITSYTYIQNCYATIVTVRTMKGHSSFSSTSNDLLYDSEYVQWEIAWPNSMLHLLAIIMLSGDADCSMAGIAHAHNTSGSEAKQHDIGTDAAPSAQYKAASSEEIEMFNTGFFCSRLFLLCTLQHIGWKTWDPGVHALLIQGSGSLEHVYISGNLNLLGSCRNFTSPELPLYGNDWFMSCGVTELIKQQNWDPGGSLTSLSPLSMMHNLMGSNILLSNSVGWHLSAHVCASKYYCGFYVEELSNLSGLLPMEQSMKSEWTTFDGAEHVTLAMIRICYWHTDHQTTSDARRSGDSGSSSITRLEGKPDLKAAGMSYPDHTSFAQLESGAIYGKTGTHLEDTERSTLYPRSRWTGRVSNCKAMCLFFPFLLPLMFFLFP